MRGEEKRVLEPDLAAGPEEPLRALLRRPERTEGVEHPVLREDLY